MTTPPFQSGPYGQPNQEPYGQGGGYGQYGQPQPPQQYGQPHYGVRPTHQWPNHGGPGQVPPPPPRKNKTPMIVAILAIAALVLAGATVGIIFAAKDSGGDQAQTTAPGTTSSDEEETGQNTEEATDEPVGSDDPYDAEPGDCIKVNSAANAEVEMVDCSDSAAIYRVGTREENDTENCPNDQYVTYTEEGRLLLCLQLNVKTGDCIETSDTVDTRVDCSDTGVTNVVLDVLDGVDDETQCTQDGVEVIVTYPTPPLTICLGGPQT